MNKLLRHIFRGSGIALLASGILYATAGCATSHRSADDNDGFVSVKDGRFHIGDSVYNFIGTNFWYGPILASEGRGGDRTRLIAELDSLHALGLDNLRILAGGDGNVSLPSHIEPTLQTAPGVYNDTILAGLDFMLSEMEKRDMKAVVYLNNAWEWSGGYGQYLEWAGEGKCPLPSEDGYQAYMDFVAKFPKSEKAQELAINHLRNIVGRTNSVTGKPYSESPAIMAWQIANEPRVFSQDGKDSFVGWIEASAKAIKEIDPNHLVSTGNEGTMGCEGDLDLWKRIHAIPEVDYATIHIWPYNWNWVQSNTLTDSLPSAKRKTSDYIRLHLDAIAGEGKPLVIEEFGFPRDNMAIEAGSPTTSRDEYYDLVMNFVGQGSHDVAGINFWGWGGNAVPAHRSWQHGDDYTGDPAQEDQGLNSVFSSDSTTLEVIRRHTAAGPRRALKAKLVKTVENGKTMFGHHDDTAYGYTWKYTPGESDVREATGKYPAMMSWDLGRIELDDFRNLDGVPFDFIRQEIVKQDARGGVNTLSWHLFSPGDNLDSWQVADTTIVHRMVNDPVTNEKYKESLRKVAAFLNSLKKEDGTDVAVIFRPWHEHTGGWFWWGAKNCSVEDYKGLWRVMREVFNDEGVDNVVWAYSPDRVTSEEQYLERYPGDEYVDILGTDVYQFNGTEGEETYRNDASRSLQITRKLAAEHHKIPAFTETGLETVNQDNWYSGVLLPILRENPVAYVVVWRDAMPEMKQNHFYVPHKGHPAFNDFINFSNDSSILLVEPLPSDNQINQ